VSAATRIVIERRYPGDIDDVWELWTTKDGIEAWWGPDGFSVTVQQLDLRPGGELVYTMTATAAPQIEFMKRAGMPLSTQTRIVFTEVTPPSRLAYQNVVDFVPGVAAYEVGTLVELTQRGGDVHLVLTMNPMHDQEWTNRAAAGWESELGKLGRALAARVSGGKPAPR
jgi:uncharacterized protein YndB with AHSA1/START domain